MQAIILIILLLLSTSSESLSLENKLSLYERKRVAFNPGTDSIPIYIGLTKDLINFSKKNLKVDFSFDKLLLQNDFDCDSPINCNVTNSKLQTAKYNDLEYTYYQANTFLTFYRISPAEIPDKIANFLEMIPFHFFTKTLNGMPSVLPLGPNSPVWNYWNQIFFFRNSILNVTYSNNPDFKFVRFYSQVDSTDTMLSVLKTQTYYSFPSIFLLGETKLSPTVCVDTTNDGYLALTPVIFDLIMNEICKNVQSCSQKDDLKANCAELTFEFKFEQIGTLKNSINVQIPANKLILFKGKQILFGFSKGIQDKFKNCDVVFLNDVFADYYFIISNDLKNKNSIQAGFRKIGSSDFFMLNLWKYIGITLFLMILTYFAIKFIIQKKDGDSEKSKDEDYKPIEDSHSFKV